MISSLKERRTIRKYLNKDIDEQLLNELLETAFRAPTTQNMQVYSVVITREQENKEKLAPAHFNQPTVTSAPVVLTFCADLLNGANKIMQNRDMTISNPSSRQLSMHCL